MPIVWIPIGGGGEEEEENFHNLINNSGLISDSWHKNTIDLFSKFDSISSCKASPNSWHKLGCFDINLVIFSEKHCVSF